MSLFHAPGRFIAETLTWLPCSPHRSSLLLRLREIDCWPDPYVVVEAIRRHDLYLVLDYPATVAIVTSALQISDRYRPDAMAVVIIDDDDRVDDQTGPVAMHRELTELLRDRLADNGTGLIAAWSVSGTAPGSSWISLLDDDHGTLPALPPTATSISTSNDVPAPVGGIRPHTATAERVAAELARHRQPPVYTAGPDGDRYLSRQRVRLVLGWAHRVHNGATVTVAGLVAMAEALQDSDVRDVLFAFALGRHGEAASPLWMVLARCLPAGHRGRPALLLAVTTYLSGRCERAMTELRYGLADAPDDPTLLAMARAFADRVPAEVLHAVARSGRTTAADLGIDLD